MAGTNVGSVYIDFGLELSELKKGFESVDERLKELSGSFFDFEGDLKGIFSSEGFSPVFGVFDEFVGVVYPAIGAASELALGLGELVYELPKLEDGLLGAGAALEDLAFIDKATEASQLGDVLDETRQRGERFADDLARAIFLAAMDMRDGAREFGRTFAGIGEGFAELTSGMETGWSGAWDAVASSMGQTVNRIIDGLNDKIKGLNNIAIDIPEWAGGGRFSFDIPAISPIPALATGGIVSTPTLALIGERGREAVLPLENNTGWMQELASTISQSLAGEAQGKMPAKVNLYMDSYLVAEALAEDLRRVNELRF